MSRNGRPAWRIFSRSGQEFGHGADLLVGDDDVGVVENAFHALGVGDEVGRHVTAVELHAFDDFHRGYGGLAFFHGDDAVFADLEDRFGDELADLRVVGRHGRDLLDLRLGAFLLFLDVDGLGHLLQVGDDGFNGLVDAALDVGGVGAERDGADAFVDDRLRENAGGGGSVTGDVVRLGRHFADELGAHVFERVFEFDVLRHGHAVVGDGGRSEFLVENDITALGTEGRFDGVGEFVDAGLEGAASVVSVFNLLCHKLNPPS